MNHRTSLAESGPNGIGPRFESAPQPDMVRAMQKDSFFLNLFKDDCRELFSNIMGNNMAQHEQKIDLMSNVCYYGVTTLLGAKSLGEEYCDLSMVCPDMETRPSTARRGFLFFVEACGPYLYNKLKAMARFSRSSGLLGRFWAALTGLITYLDAAAPTISRMHLALFYLFGRYLQISKRVAGIRYVFLRKLDSPRPGYALLGVLMCIHFFVLFLLYLKRRLFSRRATGVVEPEQEDSDDDLGSEDEVEGAADCTLCLCPRTHTTATQCGHLFCWDCISESVTSKAECPMCRAPCQPSQLLRLSHYS